MVLFLKNDFSTLIVRFFAKNQKVFKVGKIGKSDEGTDIWKKKRFHLSKRHLYQNGKAEDVLVVAGRLVLITKVMRNLLTIENFLFLGLAQL